MKWPTEILPVFSLDSSTLSSYTNPWSLVIWYTQFFKSFINKLPFPGVVRHKKIEMFFRTKFIVSPMFSHQIHWFVPYESHQYKEPRYFPLYRWYIHPHLYWNVHSMHVRSSVILRIFFRFRCFIVSDELKSLSSLQWCRKSPISSYFHEY